MGSNRTKLAWMSPKRVPSRRLTDRIPFLGDHVDALSALWDLPAEGAESDRAVLLAHGAGAPMVDAVFVEP